MSMNLQAMKARLKDRKKTFEQDNSIFPFWNMNFGETSTLRLAPYDDAMTGGFWAEKKVIPMKFVDPADTDKFVQFKAPCLEMYVANEKCPVLKYVRDLYSDQKAAQNAGDTQAAASLKSIANAHWLSNTFYYQGFVRKTTLDEKEAPENPIRVFPFTKKIHGWVLNTVVHNDEDPFERLPTGEFAEAEAKAFAAGEMDDEAAADFLHRSQGRSMLLKKVKQGEFADWNSATTWHSKWEPLLDLELEAIAKFGLHDLQKRLPERPTAEQYEVMCYMIQKSIGFQLGDNDGLWEPEWEEVGLKPFRSRGSDDSSGSTTSYRKPKAAAEKDGDGEGSTTPVASATSVMNKISLARGAKAEAKAEAKEEPKVEAPEAPETPVAETPAPKVEAPAVEPVKAGTSVMDRVKAKAAAAKAAAAKSNG